MIRDDYETDPFGDPTLQGNPWDGSAPATATAPTPIPAPAVSPDTSWSAPQTSAATPAPAADTYDAHLTNIAQAPDPASQATAQDGLARQLQADLQADGHAVKWIDGTTLSIDGRSYELGDGSTASTEPPADPTDPASRIARGDPAGGGTGTQGGSTAPAPTASADRMDDGAILAQIAQWAQMPGADPSLANDPNYWLNAIKGRGGLGADNLQYWQDASVGPTAFFNNPDREAGASDGTAQTSPWLTTTPPADPTYPDWTPSAPTYTPDFIDTSASELPGFKDILDLLSTPAAGDAQLQQLVQSIVEHPETLTDQDIEMLKAKSAEEAAVAGQSQDEELQHFGYNAGLDSSPWLAGQRAQNAWNRSDTTIQGNRNIDISAASQRNADRQQAATIGTAYSSFQSSKQAQAVGLAVNAALGKATEQRSRTQLNESLKQAATQLGLTKDNLVMTYLSHVMTDLTNNKQLDLNFDVDMSKLAEQSDEFKQTLLEQMHALAQSDDQFRANYGLAAQEFQDKKDNDAWARAQATDGAGA